VNDELEPQEEVASEPDATDQAREIEELKRKNDESLEKLKRLQAEFENYRKRAAKEREETIQLATARLVKELLLLADNFERAQAISKNSNNAGSDSQGLKMMYYQLMDILRGEGVTEIGTNCRLDPFQHEVMTKVDDPNREEDEIVECVQKGYRMKGRVIRPARVIVCKREKPAEPANENDNHKNHDDGHECREENEEDENQR